MSNAFFFSLSISFFLFYERLHILHSSVKFIAHTPFFPPLFEIHPCHRQLLLSLTYKAQCWPRSRTLISIPTSSDNSMSSGLSVLENMGQSCIPKQPFPGAPPSIARYFLSELSGSTLCRIPVAGSTFGNLHLYGVMNCLARNTEHGIVCIYVADVRNSFWQGNSPPW